MTRSRLGRALLVVGTLALVVLVLYAGFTIVDHRNEARARAATAVAEANGKVAANGARIAALAELAAQNCATLNVDAHRLNAVIDYFEAYAKAQNPGPGTDQFFAALPRPVVTRCTTAPRSSSP